MRDEIERCWGRLTRLGRGSNGHILDKARIVDLGKNGQSCAVRMYRLIFTHHASDLYPITDKGQASGRYLLRPEV